MKVKTKHVLDESGGGEYEYYEITVDNKRKIYAGSSEPEDANISRDMNFVFEIVPMLKAAWQAGKDGDAFLISETILKEDDDE